MLRAGKSIDVPVTLTQTKVEPVTVQPVNASTVLLKIPFFGETAGKDVRAALAGATGKNVIVDLRGNPGGDIEGGQSVAGALVGPGAFCVEIGQKGARKTLKTSGNALKLGKVAVLTDRGTASVAVPGRETAGSSATCVPDARALLIAVVGCGARRRRPAAKATPKLPASPSVMMSEFQRRIAALTPYRSMEASPD